MSKKIEASTEASEIPANLVYGDFAQPVADLSPKAVAYLMQYGFGKSLQDSVAGMKAKLTDEKNEDGSPKYNDAEVAVMLHDTQAKRVEAIVNGTIGARSGSPRATPFEKVLKQVAIEAIRAAASAKGISLGKANMEDLIAKYLAKNGEAANAEAKRRMESVAVENDDDLFADL